MSNDLVDQLRRYGNHLDELSQSVPHGLTDGAVLAEPPVRVTVRRVSRRQALTWTAAAAAAVAGVGSVRWVRRAAEEQSLGDSLRFVGPEDTPAGAWVRLGAESEALSVVPGRGASGDESTLDVSRPVAWADNTLDVSQAVVWRDRLVAVGSQTLDGETTAQVWVTADLSRWERWTLPMTGWSVAAHVVALDDRRLLIVGTSRYSVVVWTGESPSRMIGQVIDRSAVLLSGVAGLVRLDDELVIFAGATESTGGSLPTWRSADGTSWTRDDGLVIGGRGIGLGRPVWDGSALLAPIGGTRGGIARSADRGRTWTVHDLPHELDAAAPVAVAITPTGYVAVGDERTWDSGAQSSPSTGGKLVPIGTSRLTAWTSANGTAWTRVPVGGEPTGTFQGWMGVARADSGLVGLANDLRDGQMQLVETTSQDGSAWNVADVGSTATPRVIVAVRNGFVAMGAPAFPVAAPPSDVYRILGVWFRRTE